MINTIEIDLTIASIILKKPHFFFPKSDSQDYVSLLASE